jgi:ribosomal protein L16/L10AE
MRQKPQMLESVRRCRHCRREMKVSARAYVENPFCNLCMEERLQATIGGNVVTWLARGHYQVPTFRARQKSR